MKHFVFNILGKTISLLIKLNVFLRLYNRVYERSSQRWVNVFHQYVKLPDKNFVWNIRLRNGKIVQTLVKKGDYKTLQLAIDYKWYSPGISLLEEVVYNFYKKDLLYVDIGANLGMRSLSALSQGIRTIMFEPNEELVLLNEERCKLNRFENYLIEEKGVSNMVGEKKLLIDQSSYKSSFNEDRPVDYVDELTVEITSLDHYFNMVKENNVFVKIDVEDHEKEVILGGGDFIKEKAPLVIVEINNKEKCFETIYSAFINLEYRCFSLAAEKFEGKILKEIKSIEDHEVNEVVDFMFIKDEELLAEFIKFGYC